METVGVGGWELDRWLLFSSRLPAHSNPSWKSSIFLVRAPYFRDTSYEGRCCVTWRDVWPETRQVGPRLTRGDACPWGQTEEGEKTKRKKGGRVLRPKKPCLACWPENEKKGSVSKRQASLFSPSRYIPNQKCPPSDPTLPVPESSERGQEGKQASSLARFPSYSSDR